MNTGQTHSSPIFPCPVTSAVDFIKRRCPSAFSAVIAICLGLSVGGAQAAFNLVEDFENLSLGNINGQNSWTDNGNSGQVVSDPDDGANQALVIDTESGVLYRPLKVVQGTSRMLFLRLRFEEHGTYSFGLTPILSPDQYGEFSPELGMASATQSDPNNELRAANGDTVNVYDVLETLTPNTWYNVWVMVDAGTDTYQVWLNSASGQGAISADQLENDQAETVFGFRLSTSTDLVRFFIKTGSGGSPVPGQFYLDDIYLENTGAVNLNNPTGSTPPTRTVLAAVLPASRSVQVGNPATAFGTIINSGSDDATECGIAPATTVSADFAYQTTDPNTNALTGMPDTPVNIAAGGSQSYVFAFTPTAEISPTDVELLFDCTNTDPAPSTVGLNTLLLSASTNPVSDIVALAATQSGDGVVNLPGDTGANAFAVATVNVGSEDVITASADTGGASLPVTLSICESDAATGGCLAAPTSSVTTTIAAGATSTFSVFATGSGNVPFDPAANRIFVRFTDTGGVTRGSTSVAVRTQ